MKKISHTCAVKICLALLLPAMFPPLSATAPPTAQATNEDTVPVATRPVRSGNTPDLPPAATVAALREAYDPSPAPAVPAIEVPVDASGRIAGKPKPIAPPSAAPAFPPSSVPREVFPDSLDSRSAVSPGAPLYVPPGGAGPDDDPAAPAAPVVVQEFEIDPTGKVLGPIWPGESGAHGIRQPARAADTSRRP
ncbi:MAG: hypothetical protein LBD42_04790 [Desulfovibrio sp.]|jgi:hypothetical protein|nr:hypothetical protein [Desulfovibrio sp.]